MLRFSFRQFTCKQFALSIFALLVSLGYMTSISDLFGQESVDYKSKVKPILQKYCAGCHNDDEPEGEFSVSSFASMMRGSDSGAAFVAGDAKSSLLARVLTGATDPKMPPEDFDTQPMQADIDTLIAWIEGGGQGPDGEEPRYTKLSVPHIPPVSDRKPPITDIAFTTDGSKIAVARFQRVDLIDPQNGEIVQSFENMNGKVNRILFTNDGKWLVVGSGIVGLKGVVAIYDTKVVTA